MPLYREDESREPLTVRENFNFVTVGVVLVVVGVTLPIWAGPAALTKSGRGLLRKILGIQKKVMVSTYNRTTGNWEWILKVPQHGDYFMPVSTVEAAERMHKERNEERGIRE
jgi:hypothetical protein